MRYLDIAMAAMVGTAAIGALVVWSPVPGDALSHRLQTASALRDRTLEFVEGHGAAWFTSTPWQDVCNAVVQASNSTFVLSVNVGAGSCGAPPPSGTVSAQLSFRVASQQVTLTAW